MRLLMPFIAIVFLSCNSIDSDFQKIPKENRDIRYLFKGIIPDKKYVYWQCIFKKYAGDNSLKLIYEFGDSILTKNYQYGVPENGFLPQMWMGYYYIAYTHKDKMTYITTNNQLKKFIGKIDNLQEALLIAKTHELGFDLNKNIAGSYKKTNNGFELCLAKFYRCPIKTEAFKASIDTIGNFKSKSLNVFYDEEEICYD